MGDYMPVGGTAPDSYKERADKIADTLRALLTTLATAGIAAAYVVGGQTAQDIWLLSATAFVVSLACVLRSWFVAKDRAIRRREASRGIESAPRFTKWGWKSSWVWDTIAAWALILGVVLLVVALLPTLTPEIGSTIGTLDLGGILLTLSATAAGAWAGGAAAFRGERKKREEDRRRDQAVTMERAIFTLFRFHWTIETIKSNFLDHFEKQPELKLALKPALDPGWGQTRLDVASLDFLHVGPEQEVLPELLVRDDAFQAIVALLRERSRMVEEWVKPVAEKYPMLMSDGSPGFDFNAVVRELGQRKVFDIVYTSDELIKAVKVEIIKLPQAQAALAKVYRRIFSERPLEYLIHEHRSEATAAAK